MIRVPVPAAFSDVERGWAISFRNRAGLGCARGRPVSNSGLFMKVKHHVPTTGARQACQLRGAWCGSKRAESGAFARPSTNRREAIFLAATVAAGLAAAHSALADNTWTGSAGQNW